MDGTYTKSFVTVPRHLHKIVLLAYCGDKMYLKREAQLLVATATLGWDLLQDHLEADLGYLDAHEPLGD